MNQLLPTFSFLLLGVLLGFLLGWFWVKLRMKTDGIPKAELDENYVPRSLFQSLENQSIELKKELAAKEEDRILLETSLATKQRDLLYLEEKLHTWKSEVEDLRKQSRTEFENIASRLLEEKSQRFADQNESRINNLLQPLRENIHTFGQDIERRFTDEAKDKVSLRKEIEQLKELNSQLSSDAQLLASALKGDAKTQGDWGEFQLELLLEKAGLHKGIHFETQASFKDENGRDKRPDVLIHLPGGKHLVVDSKVSLKAYERYFNTTENDRRKRYGKAHLESLRSHIKNLSGKNYQHLYQIDSPDYVLLFVPIEPALAVAIELDSKLFLDALERNVVIVSTSTLLATMRTVSYIWQQEKQKKNVLEIARQSGLLYDKFVNFIEDLKEVGKKLDAAHSAWSGAMNKLSDSKKYGDTLIGRAEKIKKLGAKATKEVPKELTGDGRFADG